MILCRQPSKAVVRVGAPFADGKPVILNPANFRIMHGGKPGLVSGCSIGPARIPALKPHRPTRSGRKRMEICRCSDVTRRIEAMTEY